MSDNTTIQTVTIRNLEPFLLKVAQLQNKARKLNFAPIEILSVTSYRKDEWENNCKVSNLYHDIVLSYEVIKIADYEFIARIDSKENMFYVAPTKTLPKEQLHFAMDCEHCNKSRVRNDIFVLQHVDGMYKRVGSSCLASYLGINPIDIVTITDLFHSTATLTTNEEFYKSNGPSDYPLTFIFSFTKFVIGKVGYVSNGKAKELEQVATSSHVIALLSRLQENYVSQRDLYSRWKEEYINDDTEENFTDCITWLKSFETSTNDYERNLYQLVPNGYCTLKSFSFAVSAYPKYIAYAAKETEKRLQAQSNVSDYVGNIGDKFTTKNAVYVVCTHVSNKYPVYFGGGETYNQAYTFEDTTGNQYVTFTATDKCKQGDSLKLTGEIVRHEVNKHTGIKQTQLKRCRMILD